MTDAERESIYNVAVPQLQELAELQKIARFGPIKSDPTRVSQAFRQLVFEAIPLIDEHNPDHDDALMNGDAKTWLRNAAHLLLKERI